MKFKTFVIPPIVAGCVASLSMLPTTYQEREQPETHTEQPGPMNFMGRATIEVVSTSTQDVRIVSM